MEVKVSKEDINRYEDVHGGAYAHQSLHVGVDKDLDIRVQRHLVLHEVIEVFCMPWTHEKVEELVDLLADALDQLEE